MAADEIHYCELSTKQRLPWIFKVIKGCLLLSFTLVWLLTSKYLRKAWSWVDRFFIPCYYDLATLFITPLLFFIRFFILYSFVLRGSCLVFISCIPYYKACFTWFFIYNYISYLLVLLWASLSPNAVNNIRNLLVFKANQKKLHASQEVRYVFVNFLYT